MTRLYISLFKKSNGRWLGRDTCWLRLFEYIIGQCHGLSFLLDQMFLYIPCTRLLSIFLRGGSGRSSPRLILARRFVPIHWRKVRNCCGECSTPESSGWRPKDSKTHSSWSSPSLPRHIEYFAPERVYSHKDNIIYLGKGYFPKLGQLRSWQEQVSNLPECFRWLDNTLN